MTGDVRVDKWLWATRLFKTRALAAEAVKGGRVHIGGQAVKPSRDVRVGDVLEVSSGQVRRTVAVRGLAERRVSAALAAELYEETAESIAARELLVAQRRLAQPAGAELPGRPTKRERRRYDASPGARRRERPPQP